MTDPAAEIAELRETLANMLKWDTRHANYRAAACHAARILAAAIDAGITDVVVVGKDRDGTQWVRTSMGDADRGLLRCVLVVGRTEANVGEQHPHEVGDARQHERAPRELKRGGEQELASERAPERARSAPFRDNCETVRRTCARACEKRTVSPHPGNGAQNRRQGVRKAHRFDAWMKRCALRALGRAFSAPFP